jgi:hypothetical protein
MRTEAPGSVVSEARGLETATHRLSAEFAGIYPLDVVERCVVDAYEAMATTATVRQFLGILAERQARDRLRAGVPTTAAG